MVEQGRTQSQIMLVQQAGPGSLPLSNLSPDEFIGFLRKVEAILLDERLAPVIVYWSSQSAKPLLPDGARYRELLRDSFCLSVFSEERTEPPHEWAFLVESQGLCLYAYGLKQSGGGAGARLQCAGSTDPQIVRQSFNKLLWLFRFIDSSESNRLEDARSSIGRIVSLPQLAEKCKASWPVIKMPTREVKLPNSAVADSNFADSASVVINPSGARSFRGGVMELPVEAAAVAEIVQPGGEVVAEAAMRRPPKSIKGLRESAWDTAGLELPSILPPAAQEIILDIIGQLRHASNLPQVLQLAIEKLTKISQSHRGLIWQVLDEELRVTNEYSSNDINRFKDAELGAQESNAIVFDFLDRIPDEPGADGAGVIAIPDTHQDPKLHKIAPTLSDLIALGSVRARLVAQLKCRGMFSGFLELQQCNETREWSTQDAAVLQAVAQVLSVVVQQARDQQKIEGDAQEMKLINDIASLFRESKGEKSRDTLVKSVDLVAEHMGFLKSQIYLHSPEDELLVAQIPGSEQSTIHLSEKQNPFVGVFESGRIFTANVQYARKEDPYFKRAVALVVPLVSEGQRVGVLGLWERAPNRQQLGGFDRELAMTVSGQLGSIIRADQAIAQIRADQAREALINRVSNEIRQSLKQEDHIMETLVKNLQEYFGMSLCVVSLFDAKSEGFTKSKNAMQCIEDGEVLDPQLAETLFRLALDELKEGKTVFLTRDELIHRASDDLQLPEKVRATTLVPLVYAGTLKAALCLVAGQRERPLIEKDMKMVTDLADRVAVVISHAELYKEVERQAVQDPMTGLYNRRHFGEQLSKELDRFQRFGRPFSYIIVDLDYLKKINDSLGHQWGDVAIKHIAEVLKRSVRDVDTAARYGGEEFVVLLPETDARSARVVAERICSNIREKPIEGIGTITASVGVATFPTDAQDRDKLTELADQALYLAKHRGRNQVCSVSDDLLPSLDQRGEEALEVQQEAIKAKVEENASIDLKLIAEHGILGIIGTIIKIIEAKDLYTKDRSPRAAEFASRLAQALHLSKEQVTIISLAAVMHNVGKLALPEELLQKKGPLTSEERKLIEQSPALGAKMLEPAKHLHKVASVIEAYHEHWDGTGYPNGLKGEEIPLESRIIALVDAYVAMTSDRPYRPAMIPQDAVKVIQAGAGKEWDPRLVKLFLSIMQKSGGIA